MDFRTERLTVRRIREEDHGDLRALWSTLAETEYARFDRPNDTSEEAVRVRIAKWASAAESTEHMFFAVCLAGKVIGYFAFHKREDGYETGYAFHPAYHGHGYAVESFAPLLTYLRGLGIKKVFAGTAAENLPSVRFLEKTGFVRTGTETVSFYTDANGEPIRFEGAIYTLML